MKQRTLELLKYCQLQYTLRSDCPKSKEWERLSKKYSEKACWKKLQYLSSKGYTDYGTSPRGSWLTPKGEEALKNAKTSL